MFEGWCMLNLIVGEKCVMMLIVLLVFVFCGFFFGF